MSTDATIIFKEWLPDLADLNNPGLIEALNVVPINGTYEPFRPLASVSSPITTTVGAGVVAIPLAGFLAVWNGVTNAYAAVSLVTAGAVSLFESTNLSTWDDRSSGSGYVSNEWRFAQYDDLVLAIANGVVPQAHTFGASSSFTVLATSGTAPSAKHIGVINKFVVVGNGDVGLGTNGVRWSGFDAPRSWPTPNSATAVAQQAGQESLDSSLGMVTGISGGDQFGIVLQQFGLTRLTYIGPPAVFQFDQYERGRGNFYPNSVVQHGGLTYYASDKGFCVTDGVQVIDIGAGKVNETFIEDIPDLAAASRLWKVYGGVDVRRNLIYWAYPSSSVLDYRPDRVLVYNVLTKRWAHAEEDLYALFGGFVSEFGSESYDTPFAFDSDIRLASFSGTAGSAILETAETEINPGGFARVSGVKPLVGATANAVTVALGTRNNRTDAVSYTAETTANSRSGFCDFRSEARYHRARVTIAGTFNSAQGIEVDAVFSSAT